MRTAPLLLAACLLGCSSSDDVAPASSADAGADVGPTVQVGCTGTSLLPLPADFGADGPWPVGARTVTLDGLTTEIWYPAAVGSDAGKSRARYDIRKHLPDAYQANITDANNPWIDCACTRDLPLDEAHGPYPMVVFIHGTAAFREQSLPQMTHWASRGFIVVAADHPGIQLHDLLSLLIGATDGGTPPKVDQAGDVRKLLAALAAPAGDAAFLAGHLDAARLAVSGHSAGGGATSDFGDVATVLMPMAAGGVTAGAKLVSTLVLGAANDGIVPPKSTHDGYASSPAKKRLVTLANAGHLAFSNICTIGAAEGGIVAVAQRAGVPVPSSLSSLASDGCGATQLAPADGWAVIDAVTSAALEETLFCSPTAAAELAKTKSRFADVAEYAEEL